MAFPAPHASSDAPHLPVMLGEVLDTLRPEAGKTYVDCTFGAGGYTRAILDAAACRVLAIDRDPDAIAAGQPLVAANAGRLVLVHGRFADLEEIADQSGLGPFDGVVMDIGVSSMQIDDGMRGFSFLRDGPLDMRMSRSGPSAADVVAHASAEDLADIIFHLGEEPRSRSIARAIVAVRAVAPITTTLQLVKAIERATGPHRPHIKTHPATKTFQALRIHVNGELAQLADGLFAAERILPEGGRLVAVTFHSLEDRIVKRFFAERSGHVPSLSRHVLVQAKTVPASFVLPFKGHLDPSADEISRNPRARSAKLRAGIRTAGAPHGPDRKALGVPDPLKRKH